MFILIVEFMVCLFDFFDVLFICKSLRMMTLEKFLERRGFDFFDNNRFMGGEESLENKIFL